MALGNTFYAEGSALGTNRLSAKPQLRKRPMYAVIFAESQPKLSAKRLSVKYIFF
jgi:hypothetical protein